MYRAGLPTLGARLLAAAGLVKSGHTAADIGCDHGKLSVWLALKGVCPVVIAIDSRPMPLARAKALAAQTGCANVVNCRLGSGLAPLAENEADEIIIAGLSGDTIIEILQGQNWVLNKNTGLILVPSSRPWGLRRWLYQNGFALVQDVPILENGKSYSAMRAEFTGKKETPPESFCLLGLVPQSNDTSAKNAYIKARLAHLKKQALAPMDEEEKAQHTMLIKEVAAWLV